MNYKLHFNSFVFIENANSEEEAIEKFNDWMDGKFKEFESPYLMDVQITEVKKEN